jgi:hypothetical protein
MFIAEARVFAVEVHEDDLQCKFDPHTEVPESSGSTRKMLSE